MNRQKEYQSLAHYTELKEWKSYGKSIDAQIKKQKDNRVSTVQKDARELATKFVSHCSLEGWILKAPHHRIPQLHEMYAHDLQNHVKHYLCEAPFPKRRLAFDFDIDEDPQHRVSNDDCIAYVRTLQRGLRKMYPNHHDKLGTVIAIKRSKYKPDNVGMHIYFFNLIVDLEITQKIYAYLISLLSEEHGHKRQPPLKPWTDVFDEGPFTGSLRLIGSGKQTKCGECLAGRKWADHKVNGCNQSGDPLNRKAIDDEPYLPTVVLDPDGKQNETVLKMIAGIDNIHLAIMMCTTWCADDVPITPFFLPKDAPVYRSRNTKLQSYDNDTAVFAYMIKELEQGKKKRLTAQDACDETKKEMASDVAFKKRIKEKNQQSFSKEYLDYMSPTKSWKPVPEEDRRFIEVRNWIRQNMGEHYRHVDLVDLRHPSKQNCYIAKMDGIGVRYCQNKGDYHSTSCIYFYIDYQFCYQRCSSKKKEPRNCGLCCNYVSVGMRLSTLMRHLLYPYHAPSDRPGKRKPNTVTPTSAGTVRSSTSSSRKMCGGSSMLATLNTDPLQAGPISADLVFSTAGVPGSADRPLFMCKYVKPSAMNVAAISSSLATPSPSSSQPVSTPSPIRASPLVPSAMVSGSRSFLKQQDKSKAKAKTVLTLVRKVPTPHSSLTSPTPQKRKSAQELDQEELFKKHMTQRIGLEELDAQADKHIEKVIL